ncbi:hypothetical protein HDU76_006870 [Blyttiomyces sp. JEL0837]|nr:hypothetical protein HDU76_006870 [Blyttiomyces sp. JEL0837]
MSAPSPPPITLADFPPEVIDEIAYRLPPRYVHRLSLTSKTFFNRYNYPSYAFAKKSLKWHPGAILDFVMEPSMTGVDDNNETEAGQDPNLTPVLHPDLFRLGDNYLAACISLLGSREIWVLFLDLDIPTINLNEPDTWFLDFTSSKARHFCRLLSIVSAAGDIDVSKDNFLVIYFLTAVGDLDTLINLERKRLLPTDSYNQILTPSIQRHHNNIATWILSLNVVDPSAMENKAFMAAVEAGNLFMIETLLQDPRVRSTIDWNAAMATAIECHHGENRELLHLIHHKDKINLWTVLPKLQTCYQSPFRYAFELLTADWNEKQLSPNVQDNCRLYEVAIAAGSLRVVQKMQSLFDWEGPNVPRLRSCFDLAVLHRHWDIIVHFIQQQYLFHPMTYISCLKDAVLDDKLYVVKFVIESAICDDYTQVWRTVETDVLQTAAKFGNLDIVNYILSLDQVDISNNNNTALANALLFNQPRVVEVMLKSGRVVDTEVPWMLSGGRSQTARFWVDEYTRSCFTTLFHEACYMRFYHVVRVFIECGGFFGLNLSDGFAFRMAATLQEPVDCDVDDDNDGDNKSNAESIDTDSSGNTSDLESLSDHPTYMDWSKTFDGPESTRLTMEGDRIAISELLLRTGKAIPLEISTDILNAASSLPFHLFKTVMDQGQYTEDAIVDLLRKDCGCLKIAIAANQIEVFDYLWSLQNTFESEDLYSFLHTAVLYNRERFEGLIIQSIPHMGDDDGSGTDWFELLVDMFRKKWGMVLDVWIKMNDDVRRRFTGYVLANGLADVLEDIKVKLSLHVQ